MTKQTNKPGLRFLRILFLIIGILAFIAALLYFINVNKPVPAVDSKEKDYSSNPRIIYNPYNNDDVFEDRFIATEDNNICSNKALKIQFTLPVGWNCESKSVFAKNENGALTSQQVEDDATGIIKMTKNEMSIEVDNIARDSLCITDLFVKGPNYELNECAWKKSEMPNNFNAEGYIDGNSIVIGRFNMPSTQLPKEEWNEIKGIIDSNKPYTP